MKSSRSCSEIKFLALKDKSVAHNGIEKDKRLFVSTCLSGLCSARLNKEFT